jgi:hypothetical protein
MLDCPRQSPLQVVTENGVRELPIMSEQPTIDTQALHVLAQFRPFEDGSLDMQAAHDDLVVAACQTNHGGFVSLEACRQFIESTFSIELELSEVRDARDRLVAAGVAAKVGGGLELSTEAVAELDARRAAWEEAHETALVDWEKAVRRSFPAMSDKQIDVLKDQLRPWLDRVIATHGAEAGLLLHPSHPRAQQLVEAITKIDLGFLPACGPELEQHRVSAFRLLVRNPTPAQSEFLGRLLNTGFYLTVLTLDPRARHLAKAEASKITLYLDTNFLYSVLGVGSSKEAFAAKRFLELCKELGVSLRITPWTADELRTSIASSRRDVEKFARSRKVATVMAQVSGEKGFAAAYWRQARDHNETPETFFGKFTYFARFLEDYGIQEHPEGVPEVEAEVERLRLYASPLEGMYGVGARPRVVIEHDAKMRLLIERLRSQHKPPAGYTEVRYWFVTESTKLPTYARIPVDGNKRPEYPFCVLSSTWAQLLRAMVPRTDDVNEMVVGLLASPFVGYRSGPSGQTQVRALERIVSRIDSLKDVPPSVAIAVVNDSAMATKIGEEADDQVVTRMIEESLTAKAAELEKQVASAAERVVQAERERQEAEAATREAVAAQTHMERERDEAQAAAAAKDQALVDAEGARSTAEASLRTAVQDEQTRRLVAERKHRRLRNGVAVGSIVIVATVSAALIATGTVSGTIPIIGVLAGMALVIYIVVRVVSVRLAAEIVAVLSIVSAIAGIGAVVAAPSSSPREKAPANGKTR